MKKRIKKIYSRIPYKREVFGLIKKFWLPSSSVRKYLYFSGAFEVVLDNGCSFQINQNEFPIENEIFWQGLRNGIHEKVSIEIWMKLVPQSKVIFDIGSNTGIYSLVAKSLNSGANVYAFEPMKRIFKKLEENNHLNRYDIHCISKAASNNEGQTILYDDQFDFSYTSSLQKVLHSRTQEILSTTVETIRIDSFIESQKITELDLIKIDVEMHEVEVLEGIGKYLEIYKPTILIEVLTDVIGEKIEHILYGMGYLYFNINDQGQKLRQTDHIQKSDHWNYLLCTREVAEKLKLI
jgi:FkbM family methyltransferase